MSKTPPSVWGSCGGSSSSVTYGRTVHVQGKLFEAFRVPLKGFRVPLKPLGFRVPLKGLGFL